MSLDAATVSNVSLNPIFSISDGFLVRITENVRHFDELAQSL